MNSYGNFMQLNVRGSLIVLFTLRITSQALVKYHSSSPTTRSNLARVANSLSNFLTNSRIGTIINTNDNPYHSLLIYFHHFKGRCFANFYNCELPQPKSPTLVFAPQIYFSSLSKRHCMLRQIRDLRVVTNQASLRTPTTRMECQKMTHSYDVFL